MTLESVTFKDLEEIKNLQPKGWGDIILDIGFYLKSTFCNPCKATIDNNIVGTGTLITYGNTCWIAHIIVGSSY